MVLGILKSRQISPRDTLKIRNGAEGADQLGLLPRGTPTQNLVVGSQTCGEMRILSKQNSIKKIKN